jgi:hypothetical protein
MAAPLSLSRLDTVVCGEFYETLAADSLVSANSVETLASPNAGGRLRTRGARSCGSSIPVV